MDDFNLRSNINGFYDLYYQGELVYSVHDDRLNQVTDNSDDYDDRLIAAIVLADISQKD